MAKPVKWSEYTGNNRENIVHMLHVCEEPKDDCKFKLYGCKYYVFHQCSQESDDMYVDCDMCPDEVIIDTIEDLPCCMNSILESKEFK